MKKQEHGRDFAVDVLNKWFDIIDVPEDERISNNLEGEELSELTLVQSEEGEVYDDKSLLLIEKSDTHREKMILEIQRGNLILNEETKELIMKLKEPVAKADGTILYEDLKFKHRYRVSELNAAMKGVNQRDHTAQMGAMVATLTGKSRTLIEQMFNKDYKLAIAIGVNFAKAE